MHPLLKRWFLLVVIFCVNVECVNNSSATISNKKSVQRRWQAFVSNVGNKKYKDQRYRPYVKEGKNQFYATKIDDAMLVFDFCTAGSAPDGSQLGEDQIIAQFQVNEWVEQIKNLPAYHSDIKFIGKMCNYIFNHPLFMKRADLQIYYTCLQQALEQRKQYFERMRAHTLLP